MSDSPVGHHRRRRAQHWRPWLEDARQLDELIEQVLSGSASDIAPRNAEMQALLPLVRLLASKQVDLRALEVE